MYRTRPSRLRHDIRNGRKLVDPSSARRAHARELLAGRLGMRVVTEAATLGEIVVRPAAGVSASQLLFLVVTDGVEPEPSALAAYR